MTSNEVRTLVRLLHWSAPLNKQQMAVEALSRLAPEHYPLLFDWRNKPRWKNTVKVIENIGFPKNEPLLEHLFTLLQDLTWPGAEDSLRILAHLDRKWLLPEIERHTLQAAQNNDEMWLSGLLCPSQEAGLTALGFPNPETWRLLKSSDYKS